MTFLLLQAFLLMMAAYFVGAFLGCLLRRLLVGVPQRADIGTTAMAGATAGAGATGGIDVPQRQPVPVQPRIEYVEPPAGLPDSTRFERALSGVGTLQESLATPSTPEAGPPPVDPDAPTYIPERADLSLAPVTPGPVTPAPVTPAAAAEDGRAAAALAAAAAAAAAAMASTARSEVHVEARAPRPVHVPPLAPEPLAARRPVPVEPSSVGPSAVGPSAAPIPAAPSDEPAVVTPTAHSMPGGMSGASADVRMGVEPPPRPSVPRPSAPPTSVPPIVHAPIAPPAPAASAPPSGDELTLIRGIDARMAESLRGQGISSFAAIAKWSRNDVEAVNRALAGPGRVQRENWVEQAAVLASGAMTEFARRRRRGELTSGTPAPRGAHAAAMPRPAPHVAAPAAASQAPAIQRGPAGAASAAAAAVAAAAAAAARGAAAPPRPQQPAPRPAPPAATTPAAPPAAATAASTPPAAPTPRAVVARPVQVTPGPAVKPAPPGPSPTPVQPAGAAPVRQVVVTRPQPPAPAAPAVPPAAKSPPAGTPVPAAASRPAPVRPTPPQLDLLQRIRGIDATTERSLAGFGITRFAQIAAWTPADVEAFDTRLGGSGRIARENWVEQAKVLAAGGGAPQQPAPAQPAEPAPPMRPARLADAIRDNSERPATGVPSAATPGAASEPASESAAAAAARADISGLRSIRSEALRPSAARASGALSDLKRIRGIGVLIEKKLNALGISTYDQIANWTADDIERVSKALDFRGRIERENWVEQARILSAGGATDFSRRLDRGEA